MFTSQFTIQIWCLAYVSVEAKQEEKFEGTVSTAAKARSSYKENLFVRPEAKWDSFFIRFVVDDLVMVW